MRILEGRVEARLSRRGLLRRAAGLGGAAIAALAAGATPTGCGYLGSGPQWRPGGDPLVGLRAATATLAGRYEATIARHPALAERLGPLLDAHRAHLDALDRQLVSPPAPDGVTVQASPVPDDPAAALSGLVAAEKAAMSEASAACLAAPGWRAALLGSIAAARASHVEVLA